MRFKTSGKRLFVRLRPYPENKQLHKNEELFVLVGADYTKGGLTPVVAATSLSQILLRKQDAELVDGEAGGLESIFGTGCDGDAEID